MNRVDSSPIPVVVRLFSVIADGMFWRRAVDPAFDGTALVPATLELMKGLLKPVLPADQPIGATTSRSSGDR